MASYDEVNAICEFLRARINITPLVGIICGSGLGQLANRILQPVIIPYKEIPGFLQTTVKGHKGNLVFGTLGGKDVMVMQGRFHDFEGYSQQQITLPVRVMRLMGCEYLFVTNAAGGLHQNYDVGDIVVVKDHISMPALAGISPLTGPNDERFGTRFPALSNVYIKELRNLALRKADEMGIGQLMHEGVYMCCCGPTYETPAEARALRLLGADVLGMSTTAETTVAHHAGMRVLALSLVTNHNILDIDQMEKSDHDDVLEMSHCRGDTIATLLTHVLAAL
ncbi:Purine nucleoside phosphorylase [Taenia crassiceps]|uniref:Purine nucleoside phosphorylase n=1 Tax=Taenia crassiceps TaxID=6207 RepID=A0ABR4Q9B8_9CEST